jgi:tetratricopeptide (TPR) repeat protein
MRREEVEQWDVNMLVATNTFWSTSRDLKVAQQFAGIDLTTGMSHSESREDEVQYVLFEIHIDFTHSPNLIIADISHLTDFENEKELLVDLGTPLHITDKTYDEEHHVWHIQMTSTSEIDTLDHDYVSYVHQRLSFTTGPMLYGNLLAGALCNFKEAVTYFHRLLRCSPINDKNRPNIYCEIGRVYRFMGKYERAIVYYKAACLLQKRSLPQSKFGYGCALSGLAVVYSKMGDLNRAIDLNRRALAIYHTLFPENHIEIYQILDRLTDNLYQKGQYQEAYNLLSKVDQSYEDDIFLTNPQTQLYYRLGLVHKALGNRKEARKYVEKALELREKWSNKHHPYTAQIRDDLRALHAEENEEHSGTLENAPRALDICPTKVSLNKRELEQSNDSILLKKIKL